MQQFSIRILYLSLLVFCGTASVAQLKMTVQVDEKIITTEDLLQIQYTIENAQKVNKFIPPAFTGFKVMQGPDYTNGWTLINGEMKNYVAISFILRPVRKGKFLIQPATASADGHQIRSGSVAIEVNDQGSSAYYPEENEPGNQPLNDMILRSGESVQQKIKNNLFVRMELSKTSVYVGEPLEATYKLYTRLNSESRVTRRPSFSGFSVFDMVDPESEQAHYEKLDGKEYNVYLLRKVQLYPLREGKYELEEIQVDNTVSFIRESFARDQNTLNGILRAFGEEGLGPGAWIKEQVTLSSLPQVITVKPLPASSQPALFAGAVGQFTIRADVAEKQLAVGDVTNLNIVVSGSGNLPVMGNPEINWPSGIEVFDAESKEALNKSVIPITGKKIITIPFSPTTAGQLIIPAVTMFAFDPGAGKYVELKTDSIPVMVIAAAVKKTSRVNTTNLPDPGKVKIQQPPWYYILLFIVFLAGILIYFFTRQKTQKRKVRGNQKAGEISAESIAAEIPVQQLRLFPHVYTLDKAKEYLEGGHTKAFYKETEKVILSVLKEWYAIEVETGLEKMEKQLKGKYLPADTVKSTLAILDECQMALYSPFLMEDKMRADYENARQVLDILQTPQS
jgi:hypothetical protein